MKLTTLAIALTCSVASLQAVAQNVVLKPVDENFETKVCYAAATKGYDAATKMIRASHQSVADFNSRVTCNGLTVKRFAKKYAQNDVDEDATVIALVAKDKDIASKACVEALEIGEAAARAKYSLEGERILCNFKEMSQFVRQYDKENIVVRSIADDEE